MGAWIFWIGFMALIPIAQVLVFGMIHMGIISEPKDPEEWDVQEEAEPNPPQIEVIDPEKVHRKAM